MSDSTTPTQKLQQKEISTTTWWGRGISIALLVQTFGLVWYAAQLDAQVKQNTNSIQILQSRLEDSTSVTISRDQLEDILGSRDQKLENVEKAVSRIEAKLDRITQ